MKVQLWFVYLLITLIQIGLGWTGWLLLCMKFPISDYLVKYWIVGGLFLNILEPVPRAEIPITRPSPVKKRGA
jgi:hypothetical protein